MNLIPTMICGKEKTGNDHLLKFEYKEGKLEIGLPKVTNKDIQEMKAVNKNMMHDLSIDEIISFYQNVKKLWKSKSYEKREELVDLTCKMTGYSKEMIELGMKQTQELLSEEYLETTLNSELGDKRLLDEWVQKREISIHCQPRGNVLHILAGNVPPVSILSLVRGTLTKNCNIAKMPSGDVVTAAYLAQSYFDVDPEHPITKSTSVVYWPSDEKRILEELMSFVDCICVWGGKEAVETIRKEAPSKIELLEFGPRRGIQLITKEAFSDLRQVTLKAAHDLTLFDQEGCFSPQISFVEGDIEKYSKSLAESLNEENERLPKGYCPLSSHAVITNTRLYSEFRGHKVLASEKTEWTIIIVNEPQEIKLHPLGRTIFLVSVKNIKKALDYIGPETQVVAIEPFDKATELRDELTLKGVDRITHLGKMGYFAVGAPHEGMYPLSRMVRWVKSR
jgi:long-chain-fatty-acyl-CoA reductase